MLPNKRKAIKNAGKVHALETLETYTNEALTEVLLSRTTVKEKTISSRGFSRQF